MNFKLPQPLILASYACDPNDSKGRRYQEIATPYRDEFERDRDRIIHTKAFRRLQYKTQVFINHEGDHFRNRLTHSLEVATVARSCARALGLSIALSEAVALAHDLGHAPFGHAGEDGLNAAMQPYGGFCHNAHSLKLLTKIEKRYAAYDGMNLTFEALEGIAKHNGPVAKTTKSYLTYYNKLHDLGLEQYPSAEAQIASLADDISYIAHDLEDSVGANIISLKQIAEIKLLGEYIRQVENQFPLINKDRIIYEVVRRFVGLLVSDLVTQTISNLESYKVTHVSEIRQLSRPIVTFSSDIEELIKQVRSFLHKNVYHSQKLKTLAAKCRLVVSQLFSAYMQNENLLPDDWQKELSLLNEQEKAVIISDYIAGMTDRFALQEYQNLYATNFDDINL